MLNDRSQCSGKDCSNFLLSRADKVPYVFRSFRAGFLQAKIAALCVALLLPAAPIGALAQGDSPSMAQLTIGLAGDMSAAGNGDRSRFGRVIEWLDRGGDPNAVLDGKGSTFMHYAAFTHQVFLTNGINRGGDCNRRNDFGATPLHYAASQWRLGPGVDTLRMLARCEPQSNVRQVCTSGEGVASDCRADPNAQDNRGNTPLHSLYLASGGFGGGGVEGTGPGHVGPALTGGRFDVQQVLLEEIGADPNIRNNNGDTPLMLLVRDNILDAGIQPFSGYLSHLLDHGADPETRNSDGGTPLIEVVSLGPNASYEDDRQALAVRLLLKHGADPDLRARNGDTPLIRAAKHKDDSLYEIRALLAGGADPCLRDRNRWIAHQHAEEVGAEASAEALEKAGGYLDWVNSLWGVCVRDRREAEEREEDLGLDEGKRRRLQACLKTLGFDPGGTDGMFSQVTRAAIREWQVSQGHEGEDAMGYFAADDADALLETCRTVAPKPTCTPETASSCWMETVEPAGCHIWNRQPQSEETITWSGECVDGKVSGRGEAQWRFRSAGLWETWTDVAEYEGGRVTDGRLVSSNSDGDVFEGSLVDEERHGHWVMRYSDGETWEGPLTEGDRHGIWVGKTSDSPLVLECWRAGERLGLGNCVSDNDDVVDMVAAEQTEVRAGPGLDYSPVGQLDSDAEVKVVAEVREWRLIELLDGSKGFVWADSLRDASSDPVGYADWHRVGTGLSCESWAVPGYFEFATVEQVRRCIDSGLDVNSTADYGAFSPGIPFTMLTIAAARSANADIISELIDAGAKVNGSGDGGEVWTPLMAAAISGRHDLIHVLVEAGADVNLDISGLRYDWSPPLIAAIHSYETVKALIDAGADMSVQDSRGLTIRDLTSDWPQEFHGYSKLLAGGGAADKPVTAGLFPPTKNCINSNLNIGDQYRTGRGIEVRKWGVTFTNNCSDTIEVKYRTNSNSRFHRSRPDAWAEDLTDLCRAVRSLVIVPGKTEGWSFFTNKGVQAKVSWCEQFRDIERHKASGFMTCFEAGLPLCPEGTRSAARN